MRTSLLNTTALLLLTTILLACSGSGGGGGSSDTEKPVAAVDLILTFTAVKAFHFSWVDVSNATHYKLFENSDSTSGFAQVGDDIPQGTQSIDHIVPLYARLNAQYMLQSCNSTECTDSMNISVSGTLADSIGYFKASNTNAFDEFHTISLSADGSTLAVGAMFEGSNATSINGDQTNEAAPSSGAVYIFTRSGSSWTQQAYLKASNTNTGDRFGIAISLSADGNTLAVGARDEESNATTINGDQTNNTAGNDGAVYLFVRSGNNWSQQAYIKADDLANINAGLGLFGLSVSLSADGNTLAAGAGADSGTIGGVYVFIRISTNWSQEAFLEAGDLVSVGLSDFFGEALSLSADGNTLAVGARNEASAAIGVSTDGTGEGDDSAMGTGAVYIFTRSGATWSRQAYIKASNSGGGGTVNGDLFGISVSLSEDGDTLAVGAIGEDSNAIGVNGGEGDDLSFTGSGAAYIFSRNGSNWNQQAYIKASNTGMDDAFGIAVSISTDGNTLAVGASSESSSATGINSDESNDSAAFSGAAYIFKRSDTNWSQQAYIKANVNSAGSAYGRTVKLSADGNTLAIGANAESSASTGVDSTPNDNGSANNSGAVYLY
ncbi:hypothetical protein MNBD_GAMMA17-1810 [hydrothermal vent metagenome]|uniref:Integrin n=1 Tax=hydrothermal vent metagenome TaxID=652676 RepID=A0A3B0ZNV0_9ZZZZ